MTIANSRPSSTASGFKCNLHFCIFNVVATVAVVGKLSEFLKSYSVDILTANIFVTSRYCLLTGDFPVHQALPELNNTYSGFEFSSEDEYRTLGALPLASKGFLQSRKEEK